jgi:hypothetical protein
MDRRTFLRFLTDAAAASTLGMVAGCAGSSGGRTIIAHLTGRIPERPSSPFTVLRGGNIICNGTTNANGVFICDNVGHGDLIVVGVTPADQLIYRLSVTAEVDQASIQLTVIPIAGQSDNQAVTVLPSPDVPAGQVAVTSPQTGQTVPCDLVPPHPGVCQFTVSGTANPVLGQPPSASRFFVYVLVHPTAPADFFFPQFPRVAIDPGTGEWQAKAQIGPNTNTGDRFELTVIVTTEILREGTINDPTKFETPVDVPGVVYVAPFVRNLVVGTIP